MRSLHFAVGMFTVTIFLITGQFMRHHFPPMDTLSDATRLLYRSRHIYILASGLVNLMLGLYAQRQIGVWRSRVQTIGSAVLLVSPALLLIAFAVEPGGGIQSDLAWSHAGLYTLFLGCILHLVSKRGKSREESEQTLAHSSQAR